MPVQEHIEEDSLYHKLPKQHWVLRYGGLLIIGLILILLTSLYYIQIPSFFLIELHTNESKNLTGVSVNNATSEQFFKQHQEFVITLENGKKGRFRIKTIQPEDNHFRLNLETIEMAEEDFNFLQAEYISIGKVQQTPKPLIWSLISI